MKVLLLLFSLLMTHNIRAGVLLVHGYAPDATLWQPIQSYVTRLGCQVTFYRYDWRQNLNEAVASLKRYLEKTTIHTIIAHSMGGLVARWAVSDSRKPVRLISLATPFGGSDLAKWTHLIPENFPGIQASHRNMSPYSAFIREQPPLSHRVRHIKIETIEAGQWQKGPSGWRYDDVVPLHSQRLRQVDKNVHIRYQIAIGHSEGLYQDGELPEKIQIILNKNLRCSITAS